MKFVPDCARDIMIAVEALGPDKTMTIPRLAEMYPDYSEDVLNYHCLKLLEAGFVDGVTVDVARKTLPQVSKLYALSFEGHQALEDMRPTPVWKQVSASISSNLNR